MDERWTLYRHRLALFSTHQNGFKLSFSKKRVDRPSGPKQDCWESRVRITFSFCIVHSERNTGSSDIYYCMPSFSHGPLPDNTNSVTEVGVQLPERWVTLHLSVQQYVGVWGNGCRCTAPSHPALGKPQDFNCGMLNKQTNKRTTHTKLAPFKTASSMPAVKAAQFKLPAHKETTGK